MIFINRLYKSITKHADFNAFCINDNFYTYTELARQVSKIRSVIINSIGDSEKLIGLVTNDDIETYAAIIALWLEGKAYVPVNPIAPIERNVQVFELTKIKYVIDSSEDSLYKEFKVIASKELPDVQIDLKPKEFDEEQFAYILFTSGTTGVPKGVPITFSNLNGLVTAIDSDSEFNLLSSDRCLQMFELTFDFSLVTYVLPLLSGSCIYTIPKDAIKYFYIFKLINKHKLTVLTMVPSIINYLKPYFSEIHAPEVRYCSFGGGALYSDIVSEWSNCIPNCQIFNYYGPTEYTVYSGYYAYQNSFAEKDYNGIISIGKPLTNVQYIVVDEKNIEVPCGVTGELCLGGAQLTPGYWMNQERNNQSFFEIDDMRYYKTGDLCFKDEEGDFMYVGRVDFQVKVRGYRVELAEIEFHAKSKSQKKANIVAVDIVNTLGNTELGLVIESEKFDTKEIFRYLKTKVPNYMIPTQVKFVKEFPHNINGKVDRKELRKLFSITN